MKDNNSIDANNNDIVYINNDLIDNVNHMQILQNCVYNNKTKCKLKLNTSTNEYILVVNLDYSFQRNLFYLNQYCINTTNCGNKYYINSTIL